MYITVVDRQGYINPTYIPYHFWPAKPYALQDHAFELLDAVAQKSARGEACSWSPASVLAACCAHAFTVAQTDHVDLSQVGLTPDSSP